MSSYKVLSRVNYRLRAILWSAYEKDSEIRSIINSPEAISFSSPLDTSRDANNRLSIWLYHLDYLEFASARPERPAQGPPSLPLGLYYLITPFASTDDGSDTNLLLLGKTMQVMYDNSVMTLEEVDFDVHEQIHVTVAQGGLEELSRIWDALREPYRLSLSYLLKIVRIDSSYQPTKPVR